MNFWEYMNKGLCHGGYVIGLVIALIIAAALGALLILTLSAVFGKEEDGTEFERSEKHVRKNHQL